MGIYDDYDPAAKQHQHLKLISRVIFRFSSCPLLRFFLQTGCITKGKRLKKRNQKKLVQEMKNEIDHIPHQNKIQNALSFFITICIQQATLFHHSYPYIKCLGLYPPSQCPLLCLFFGNITCNEKRQIFLLLLDNRVNIGIWSSTQEVGLTLEPWGKITSQGLEMCISPQNLNH